MTRILERWRLALAAAAGAVTTLLPGCGSPPTPPAQPPVAVSPVPPVAHPHPSNAPDEAVSACASAITSIRASGAATARAYRADAATHVYGLNKDRIYQGRLPPLLYAIGTLQV